MFYFFVVLDNISSETGIFCYCYTISRAHRNCYLTKNLTAKFAKTAYLALKKQKTNNQKQKNKKMKAIKTTLFFILTILTFGSCIKPIETVCMSEEMKSFIDFPVGSWWVYRDTSNNIVDSFYLETRTVNLRRPVESYIEYEYLEQRFSHNNNSGEFGMTSLESQKISGSRHSDHFLSYNQTWFSYFATEVEFKVANKGYVEHFDSVVVFNKIYYDVRVFSNFMSDSVFWCKDVGVIKKIVNPNNLNDTVGGRLCLLEKYYINK